MSKNQFVLGKQPDLSIFLDTMVEMNLMEVKESAEKGDVVLLPIGIIEEHGPHMDLSPDIYMAYIFCRLLRLKLDNKGIHSIIAPPYYWGISEDVKKYPGTFSVRPETFKAMLMDIFGSLSSWGFSEVFIINAHGDKTHVETIRYSVKEANNKLDIHAWLLSDLDFHVDNPPIFPKPREGKFEPDYHAGANETAAVWTFYPEKVDVEVARGLKPQNSFDPLGYCGDPASFDLEKYVIEFFEADAELDSLRIKALVNNCL
ncbi:MAG: creatininase family protein [Clostridiaceae bacterium]